MEYNFDRSADIIAGQSLGDVWLGGNVYDYLDNIFAQGLTVTEKSYLNRNKRDVFIIAH